MSQSTSTLSKFVGLTSLGLLTGSSLTLTLLTTPTLLSLPSTSHASVALCTLSERTRSLQRMLSQTSLVALLAAWTLSPREARHPYLIWTALPVAGVWGWEIWGKEKGFGDEEETEYRARAKGKGKGRNFGFGSGSEDEDGWRALDEAEAAARGEGDALNGESVRDGLLEFKRESLVKGAIYGFSFVLGLVGIWDKTACMISAFGLQAYGIVIFLV